MLLACPHGAQPHAHVEINSCLCYQLTLPLGLIGQPPPRGLNAPPVRSRLGLEM